MARIQSLLPVRKWSPEGPGRPSCDRRQIINGIIYLTKTGCQWEMLPKTFGCWQSLQKIGVLHPDPEHSFAIRYLPTTPFVRVTSLPTVESGLATEWTVHQPTLPNDYYAPIELTDADYKGLR